MYCFVISTNQSCIVFLKKHGSLKTPRSMFGIGSDQEYIRLLLISVGKERDGSMAPQAPRSMMREKEREKFHGRRLDRKEKLKRKKKEISLDEGILKGSATIHDDVPSTRRTEAARSRRGWIPRSARRWMEDVNRKKRKLLQPPSNPEFFAFSRMKIRECTHTRLLHTFLFHFFPLSPHGWIDEFLNPAFYARASWTCFFLLEEYHGKEKESETRIKKKKKKRKGE